MSNACFILFCPLCVVKQVSDLKLLTDVLYGMKKTSRQTKNKEMRKIKLQNQRLLITLSSTPLKILNWKCYHVFIYFAARYLVSAEDSFDLDAAAKQSSSGSCTAVVSEEQQQEEEEEEEANTQVRSSKKHLSWSSSSEDDEHTPEQRGLLLYIHFFLYN